MSRIGKIVDALCATVSGLCLVGMVIANFLDSIGRQISMPVLGAQEFVSFALCIFFFASFPILVRENAHIRVGLLVELFSPLFVRIERYWTAAFEIFGTGLLVYLLYDFAGRLERIGTLSGFFIVPIWPFVYAATCLAALAIFFVIEAQVTAWRGASDGDEQDAQHPTGSNRQ